MKQITDTGHHLLEDPATGRIICDCGWRSVSAGKGNQAIEALHHHEDVCERLVDAQVWYRRLWKWVRGA